MKYTITGTKQAIADADRSRIEDEFKVLLNKPKAKFSYKVTNWIYLDTVATIDGNREDQDYVDTDKILYCVKGKK